MRRRRVRGHPLKGPLTRGMVGGGFGLRASSLSHLPQFPAPEPRCRPVACHARATRLQLLRTRV
jgi:hypothetical protein